MSTYPIPAVQQQQPGMKTWEVQLSGAGSKNNVCLTEGKSRLTFYNMILINSKSALYPVPAILSYPRGAQALG